MYLREHPGDMLRLKREHTYKVLAHARAIVAQEGLASQEGRAALLAALYHDTGRFPQYVRWRTFSDAESENHGYLGVHVVKKEHFLTGEPQNIHKWVLTAIALHNRYALPALPEPYLTITHAVRDADKLDIMRIMAQHFTAHSDAGRRSPCSGCPKTVVSIHCGYCSFRWYPQLSRSSLCK